MKLFVLTIVFWTCLAQAKFLIGGSVGSQTSGRVVPGLYSAVQVGAWLIAANVTGARTPLYYNSGYMLNAYPFNGAVGNLLWGQVEWGLGFGGYYAERGYREDRNSKIYKDKEGVIGPAFRVEWNALGPLYVAIDGTFGILGTSILFLTPQDVIAGSVGVEF